MERRLETPRAAGVAGIVFSVLFVVSMLFIRERPAPGSSATQIADFYLGHEAGRVALVGMYLVPFAGIAFLWFIAAIRTHLGAREDQFFATVFLGSGLLFVGMLFAASASGGALLAAVKFQELAPRSRAPCPSSGPRRGAPRRRRAGSCGRRPSRAATIP